MQQPLQNSEMMHKKISAPFDPNCPFYPLSCLVFPFYSPSKPPEKSTMLLIPSYYSLSKHSDIANASNACITDHIVEYSDTLCCWRGGFTARGEVIVDLNGGDIVYWKLQNCLERAMWTDKVKGNRNEGCIRKAVKINSKESPLDCWWTYQWSQWLSTKMLE